MVVSLATRKKLSEAQKRIGNKPPNAKGLKRRPESIAKLKRYLTGRKRPEISGKNCHFWKGGVTPKNTLIRQSVEYKLWRTSVFTRDNFTCIWCGSKNEIQADHIKPFASFPELRFSIDNGRTLCKPCHKTTDTYLKPKRLFDGTWNS